jgi:hypothetical protein
VLFKKVVIGSFLAVGDRHSEASAQPIDPARGFRLGSGLVEALARAALSPMPGRRAVGFAAILTFLCRFIDFSEG